MPDSEPKSFTFKISDAQAAALREILEQEQFEFSQPLYTIFGAKKGKLTVNAYTSGKLLVQGKGARDFVIFTVEPRILGEAKLGYEEVHSPEMFEPHLGIDESGKGDFFGPLVIAGVYVDKFSARALLQAGARDSKLIKSDRKAVEMSDEIKKIVGTGWSVVAIGPEKYNALYYQFKNLNSLLAWGHATVIENLLERFPDCPRALSDQFGNPRLIQNALKTRGQKIVLDQRTKAESDLAVAAASIIARAEFITRLEKLGNSVGEKLPKGASSLVKEVASRIYKINGGEALARLTKKHFKTFAEITGDLPKAGDLPMV